MQLALPFAAPADPPAVYPAPRWPTVEIPCHACGLPVARTVAVLDRLGTRLVAVPHAAPCGLPCAAGGVGEGTHAHWSAGNGGTGCSRCGTRPVATTRREA